MHRLLPNQHKPMTRNAHRITKRLPTLPGVTTLAATSRTVAASWVAVTRTSRTGRGEVADRREYTIKPNDVDFPTVEPESQHSASNLRGLPLVRRPGSHPLGMVVGLFHLVAPHIRASAVCSRSVCISDCRACSARFAACLVAHREHRRASASTSQPQSVQPTS